MACKCFFVIIINDEYDLWDCPFDSCIYEGELKEFRNKEDD